MSYPRSADETQTIAPAVTTDDVPPAITAATAIGSDAEPAPPSSLDLPERYADLRQLGSGGFAEVRLVLDKRLDRPVAMKILRPDLTSGPAIRARFLAEIKLTAALHHPGIVAVHDYGELSDGRLWFTMAEVRGRTLRAVFQQAFTSGAYGAYAGRRRLLDMFARVCEAVAFAHSRGVIHRDLKPDNIMVGDFGRVLVMDWGIARRLEAEPPISLDMPPAPREISAEGLTERGAVLGTPAYMPPEQARGDLAHVGPRADVYALGAILYHLLSGRPPYSGGAVEVLTQVLSRLPPALTSTGAPAELIAICERAMARDPEDRYPDAGELATAITSFLDGAQRRERALAELGKAISLAPGIARLRERAEALRAEAKQLMEPVKPFDPVESKLPGWEREDEAERLDREAALSETLWSQEVHGALAIDPDLPEAHAALAEHYREKLIDAERAHRDADAARFEVLLRAHDRGEHAAFLSGKGALTLLTDPPGARVSLYRYVPTKRRLVPERMGEIGPTPILDMALPQGSYLLRLSAPGRVEVAYPVLIERGELWDGCPPGSREPYPVVLPLVSELSPHEIYVPAGWAWTGGDPAAMDSLPRRRVWVDGFFLGRHPITNAEYLDFLNSLVTRGREEEALAACPRVATGLSTSRDALLYERDDGGRFTLGAGGGGRESRADWPVVQIDWHNASLYARRRAEESGLPYRLPDEIEREKAARGVDGRLFPWGNHFDATWACVIDSHRADATRVSVEDYPLDESPYGIRGLAGNVLDWCANVWTREGPEVQGGRLCLTAAAPEDPEHRAVRGGAWTRLAELSRSAARFAARPGQRWTTTGMRLARSLKSAQESAQEGLTVA